jgi:hypothetical protein
MTEADLARLVTELCLSNAQVCAERDAWRDLAESRGAEMATLRVMLSQALTLLHDREQAEARRSERVVRLLDGLPHLRASIVGGLMDECERLRAEQDAPV